MASRETRPAETEVRSTLRLNRQRKKLKCLGCHRTMITDRCHRFCKSCSRRNRHHGHAAQRGRLSRSDLKWSASLSQHPYALATSYEDPP